MHAREKKEIERIYQAIATAKKGNHLKKLSDLYCDLGQVYSKVGEYGKAVEVHMEEVEAVEKRMSQKTPTLGDKRDLAVANRMVGEAAANQKEFTIAIKYCKEYLRVSTDINDANHSQLALHVIGWTYKAWSEEIEPTEVRLKRELLQKSIKYYKMSLNKLDDVNEKEFEKDKEDTYAIRKCRLILNIAVATLEKRDGNVEAALKFLDLALQTARNEEDQVIIHKCLYGKAEFLLRVNRLDEARETALKALRMTKKQEEKYLDHIVLGFIHLKKCSYIKAAVKFKVASSVMRKHPTEAMAAKNLAIEILKLVPLNNKYHKKRKGCDKTPSPEGHKELMRLAERIGDTFGELASSNEDYKSLFNSFAVDYYLRMRNHCEMSGSTDRLVLCIESLFVTYQDDGMLEKALEVGRELMELEAPKKAAETAGIVAKLLEELEKPFDQVSEAYNEAERNGKAAGCAEIIMKKIYENWFKYLERITPNLRLTQKLKEKCDQFPPDEDCEEEVTEQNEVENSDNEMEESQAELEYDELCIDDDHDDVVEMDEEAPEGTANQRRNIKGRPKVKLNEHGENALHVRAREIRSNLDVILKQEKMRNIINDEDFEGWRPLHEAANAGRVKNIRILIEHGAELNATNRDGTTPLISAAMAGEMDAMDALLDAGADHTMVDKDGNGVVEHLIAFRDYKAPEAAGYYYSDRERKIVNDYLEKFDAIKGMSNNTDFLRNPSVVSRPRSSTPASSQERGNRPMRTRNENLVEKRKKSRSDLIGRENKEENHPESKRKRPSVPENCESDDEGASAAKQYRNVIKELRPSKKLSQDKNSDPLKTKEAKEIDLPSSRISQKEFEKQSSARIVPDNVIEFETETDEIPSGRISEMSDPLPQSSSPIIGIENENTDLHAARSEDVSQNSSGGKSWSPSRHRLTQLSNSRSGSVPHSSSPSSIVSLGLYGTPLSASHATDTGRSVFRFHVSLEEENSAKSIIIPVPKMNHEKPVKWLVECAEERFEKAIGRRPILKLKTATGGVLSEDDPIWDVLEPCDQNLVAMVSHYESVPLSERYKKQCDRLKLKMYKNYEERYKKAEESGEVNLAGMRVQGIIAESLISALRADDEHGIETVILDRNQLGQVGFKELGQALPYLTSLRHLSLASTGLTAISLEQMLEGIKEPLVLKRLSLSSNPLAGEIKTLFHQLLAVCPFLESLDISSSEWLTPELLYPLKQFTSLKSLNLGHGRKMTADEMTSLNECLPPNLEQLYLSGLCSSENGYLACLRNISAQSSTQQSLRKLVLNSSPLGQVCLGDLGVSCLRLRALEELQMRDTSFNDQTITTFLGLIKDHPSLSRISFMGCKGYAPQHNPDFVKCIKNVLVSGLFHLKEMLLPYCRQSHEELKSVFLETRPAPEFDTAINADDKKTVIVSIQ